MKTVFCAMFDFHILDGFYEIKVETYFQDYLKKIYLKILKRNYK